MKMSIKVASTIILNLILWSSAHAKEKGFFVQLNGGIASPKSASVTSARTATVNNSSVKLGRSAIYELETGYKSKNFSASLSFDYLPNFSKTKSLTVNNTYTYTGKLKDKSYLGMFNLYLNPFTFKGFTPFVMAGIGYGRNSTKITASGPAGTFTGSTINTNNTVYKFGLGTKYQFTRNIYGDVRYQYMNLGNYKIGQSKYTGATSKLVVNEFMAGVGYKF